jgi:hypothetical protein
METRPAKSGFEYGETFSGLARLSDFSVRDCKVAAATGRLAGIVEVAERRRGGRHGALVELPPVPPVLTGREALARVELLGRRWS